MARATLGIYPTGIGGKQGFNYCRQDLSWSWLSYNT